MRLVNAYDFTVDGIAYNKLSDTTVEVTFLGVDYNSGKDYTLKEYVIPASVVHQGTTYSVVKIGDSAFYGSAVESVTLPQTVTELDNYAFGNCRSMKSINLPKGITSIPAYALTTGSSSKIETLTLDVDPTTVTADIFTNSSKYLPLKTVIIGPELNTLKANAFDYWCNSAENLVISPAATPLKIEGTDFARFNFAKMTINRPVSATLPEEAKWLEEIHVGSIDPFSTLTFVPENYTRAMLYVHGSKLAAYQAADGWKDFKYIKAEPGTLPDQTYGFHLQLDKTSNEAYILEAGDEVPPYTGDIVIPEYVIYSGARFDIVGIDNSAFRSTDITSVKFGPKVKSVGQGAFQGCRELTEVELNDGLKELAYDVFSATPALQHITIPGSVKTIPYGAFSNSGLKSVEILEGVTEIEEAFTGCQNLEEVILPNTLVKLAGTFEDCSSLKEIKLPESLRTIGTFTFANTAIQNLVVPEGITNLDGQSLGCMNGDYNADYTLKSVTLPASLSSINYRALNNRRGVEELIINGSTPLQTDARFLSAQNGECPLKKLTLNRILTDANGTDITSVIFNKKTVLEEVTFGEELTAVPEVTSCTSLKNITVNQTVAPAAGGFAEAVYQNAVLNIPAGSLASYQAHPVWGQFLNIQEPAKATALDMSKIKCTVGTGANKYAFVLANGNSYRLDNLVWGVKSDRADLTSAEAISLIAENDKRVKLEKEGDAISAIYFDLNGDGEFNAKDTGFAGDWAKGGNLLASDGTTPVLSMAHAGAPVDEVPYYFYIPNADEEGVWLPESMTVKLSDEGTVLPVLVQVPDGKLNSTTNWQASSTNESYRLDRTIIVTPYTLIEDTYNAKPSFTGKTGTTYVRYRPQKFGEYAYYESNFMTLNVEAPEVPMTAIHCSAESISAGLNKTVDFEYTYEPENATYTAVNATVQNTSLASFSATTGLTTKQVEGQTTVTIAGAFDANVKDDFTLNVALLKPVTNVHFGHGTENGVINVPVKQLIGLKPVVEPADADIPDVDITLYDNGTSKDDFTCSTYKVNWWDINNVRSQFYELSGHRPTGDKPARVHVESKDGKFVKDFVVNVIESDRTPLENGYVDGTIILNEEWFGHTNGGLNYLTPDDEVIYQAYERENPGQSFGCTSQYGAIWNDKLFVVSKQPDDGGDVLRGGGCLVIADAKTMKKIGGSYAKPTFNGMTGDGRAVAGATPNKIYVTTSNGIYIYDITDVENPVITGRIGNEDSKDLYNGQVGDIINGGKYVFAVMQAGGLMCINPETDEVTPITDPNIQGVTQTADGTVWYATATGSGAEAHAVFVALDPETLEEIERVHMPASIGMVQCGWGAWRSTAFKGDHKTGDLWFVTGAAGIMGGATGDYYRYTPGTDPSTIEPFFTLKGVTGINDFGEEVPQMTYGTPAFDARNNRLIVMTGRSGAASGGYRDHWIHFVDGTSREITRTIKLNAYYWFQSLPIFPDKHEAIINLDDITFDINDGVKEIDLSELVSDEDNIDANIKLSIVDTPELFADFTDNTGIATVVLEGKKLTVTPNQPGVQMFTLTAESNGRVTSKTLPVKITDVGSGIDAINSAASIACDGRRIYVKGLNGDTVHIYDLAGSLIDSFPVDSDKYILDFGTHKGIYVITTDSQICTKVVIK